MYLLWKKQRMHWICATEYGFYFTYVVFVQVQCKTIYKPIQLLMASVLLVFLIEKTKNTLHDMININTLYAAQSGSSALSSHSWQVWVQICLGPARSVWSVPCGIAVISLATCTGCTVCSMKPPWKQHEIKWLLPCICSYGDVLVL